MVEDFVKQVKFLSLALLTNVSTDIASSIHNKNPIN